MYIYYNNEKVQVQNDATLKSVIEQFEIIEHKAVWLNGQHVPLSDFDRIVKVNDHIKVVRIRGGG